MKRMPLKLAYAVVAAALGLAAAPSRAEEVWLHDNTRVYGLVQRVEAGKLAVFLPTGQETLIPLEDIVAIRFLGRNPLLIQSGTQEFRFLAGGSVRGQVLSCVGDLVRVDTPLAGVLDVDLAHVRGFVSLPMIGLSSLKAEEMIDSEPTKLSEHKDMLIDRRGSEVNGVMRQMDRTVLQLDVDDLLQVKPFKIPYLKGVRLADATRAKVAPWNGEQLVMVTSRDNSMLIGRLTDIRFHKWVVQAPWCPGGPVRAALDEIAQVQVMGGKVQYLSQLTPGKVEEKTVLAPPQPFQKDRNCQKDSLSIAGKRYPWGLGVHADSELTFPINGRYVEFRADIGIDTRMGDRGSVVFQVLGDGKSLYTSPVIKGGAARPTEVSVPVSGVQQLTLKVTNADDLDLGDMANWGSARVLQVATAGAAKP
jgi:hypothetical protein